MQFENSDALNEYMAEKSGGVAILSFSTGKDSIVSWLKMRRYFNKIVPYYLYLFPNISFVDRSLEYYEDYFGTRILRIPHPFLYKWIRNYAYQTPENCPIIEAAGFVDFDFDTVNDIIREDYGLGDDVYAASGVRARDSLNRWTSIKKYGPVNDKRMTFFPIYDYDKAMMVAELRESGIKLPVDYRLFGRTLDGFDYRFLKPLHDHFPEDYARIVELFPLLPLILDRVEYKEHYFTTGGKNKRCADRLQTTN